MGRYAQKWIDDTVEMIRKGKSIKELAKAGRGSQLSIGLWAKKAGVKSKHTSNRKPGRGRPAKVDRPHVISKTPLEDMVSALLTDARKLDKFRAALDDLRK